MQFMLGIDTDNLPLLIGVLEHAINQGEATLRENPQLDPLTTSISRQHIEILYRYVRKLMRQG